MSRMLTRRVLARALGGGAAGVLLTGHTPYQQWVVYRQRHLLIGCHRQDSEGYALAKVLEAALADRLPEARARVARAPDAARLASLFNTGQLDFGLLRGTEAATMREGRAQFAAYGPVPLQAMAVIDRHVLYAMPRVDSAHVGALLSALHDHRGAFAFAEPTAEAGPPHAKAADWFADGG